MQDPVVYPIQYYPVSYENFQSSLWKYELFPSLCEQQILLPLIHSGGLSPALRKFHHSHFQSTALLSTWMWPPAVFQSSLSVQLSSLQYCALKILPCSLCTPSFLSSNQAVSWAPLEFLSLAPWAEALSDGKLGQVQNSSHVFHVSQGPHSLIA